MVARVASRLDPLLRVASMASCAQLVCSRAGQRRYDAPEAAQIGSPAAVEGDAGRGAASKRHRGSALLAQSQVETADGFALMKACAADEQRRPAADR